LSPRFSFEINGSQITVDHAKIEVDAELPLIDSIGERLIINILFVLPLLSGFNQEVTVTTLVADDDVWVASPGKYA
jgi:hypothetical protein